MIIFPAIDIVQGKAVRLFKGDYNQMTVYSNHPETVALDFKAAGASHIHIVDLEGAKNGLTPNFETVKKIKKESGLFAEIGGGVRNLDVIEKYLDAGLDRVILGTAAVNDREFLAEALKKYGYRIAVGIDIKDGFAAIKGWTVKSELNAFDFAKMMQDMGAGTLICTDISKDGAMQGTNRGLYEKLSSELDINITASGGVSSIEDVKYLTSMKLYGAIIGKAYYTGAIDLASAIKTAKK